MRYDGRIWIRIGPRRAIASRQDEHILNEKRQANDKSADLQLIRTATWKDIDLTHFRTGYLQRAFAPEVLEANERTDVQRLTSLKMVGLRTPHYCTLAGCLAPVEDATWHIPGAYVQWLRIDGTDIAAPKIDELAAKGRVEAAIAAIDHRLLAFHTTEVDYGTTARERRFSRYPMAALKELVRNAVMHRSYLHTNAPVQVYRYNDHISIRSPGGPYGDVSIENFGRPEVASYRNPILAEAMQVLGLVQRF